MKSGLVNRGFINQMADVNADLSRFMLENANEAVYVYDEGCQLVYVNELAIKDSGYSKAELLEMKIMDLDPVFSQPPIKSLKLSSSIFREIIFQGPTQTQSRSFCIR